MKRVNHSKSAWSITAPDPLLQACRCKWTFMPLTSGLDWQGTEQMALSDLDQLDSTTEGCSKSTSRPQTILKEIFQPSHQWHLSGLVKVAWDSSQGSQELIAISVIQELTVDKIPDCMHAHTPSPYRVPQGAFGYLLLTEWTFTLHQGTRRPRNDVLTSRLQTWYQLYQKSSPSWQSHEPRHPFLF